MSDKNIRLVLLSCCAPCSSGAIKQLADGAVEGVDDFIVLFYNPNIFPETEYTKRMAEQIKYCEALGVKYAVLEYDHAAWREAVRGFEAAPERGARCSLCFEYRFRRAVRFARENGYNAIGSVLGVSRHKDQAQVDAAAIESIKCPPLLAGGDHDSGRGVANYHKKHYTERALSQSRVLKKQMTDAERLLWYYLRGGKEFSFRKQAPIGNYIVDFLCVNKKLIVEVDGGQHGDQAHRMHDTERDAFLSNMGYRILRFWNDEIFKNIDGVLHTINICLNDISHPLSPHVSTSPAKGGGNYIRNVQCLSSADMVEHGSFEADALKCPPPLAGGDHDSGRGVAKNKEIPPTIHQGQQSDVVYLPIRWDENLRVQINRSSDFYRQNYCGCEFSIRKV